MDKRDELIKIFSLNIRTILEKIKIDFGHVQEIRLRVQAPLMLISPLLILFFYTFILCQ